MTWTQSILDDEKHFPQKIGQSSTLFLGDQLKMGRSQVPLDVH